jgi:hypothetical protein
MIPLAQEG